MDGKQLIAIVAIVLSGLFWACNKDEGSTTGTLKINLTDAPFPTDLVDEASVTISQIEIRRADEGEGSPYKVLSTEEMTFNLLELTNGVTAELVNLEIEAGEYDLIRLYVTDSSIKLIDGTEYELKVPGGAQTGIKVFVKPSLNIKGGLTSELLLDFDVSQSFVLKGNINDPQGIVGFNFKPVIRAVNMSTAGRLVGTVTDIDDVAIDGAQVSISLDDEAVTSTFTDENGAYTLLGIEAGNYSVAYEKQGYDKVVVDAIEIVASNKTTHNVQLTAVDVAE